MNGAGSSRRMVFDDLGALSRAAAEIVLERARRAVARHGHFSLVLAGGGTPRTLYETLSVTPFSESMPWDKTLVLWGDERCVPPEDPESNYGLARDALLGRVPVPESNLLRLRGEVRPVERAAAEYESHLRAVFPGQDPPGFDLLLLGIGADGHVASLFPNSPLLNEKNGWVHPAEAPVGYPTKERLTLSLPLVNAARCVLVLAAGAGKRAVLERLFHLGQSSDPALPASLVHPSDGELIFCLDRAACPT
ncbi:6-phosphogluconolactonase [bacterium]|nr:6-phosphogluconolactonase [bacterium]